jgi:predicted PurR-regulated permease PerM
MSKSWSKTTRYFVLALSLAGILWFMMAASALLVPLGIAAVLAFLLNPTVTYVNKNTKLERTWAVLLVYLFSLALLVTAVIILVPIIPAQVANLVEELQIVTEQIQEQVSEPMEFMGFDIPLDQIVGDIEIIPTDFIQADVIIGLFQSASTNIGWVLLILVTTYYLLQDWPQLRDWLLNLAPDDYSEDTRRLYQEIKTVWQRYLKGQLRLTLIIGFFTGLGGAMIGLPGWLAIGILAGVLDIILTVGPAVVMIVIGLVAYFAGSTYLPMSNIWFAVLAVGLSALLQVIEQIWLRPRIMGHSLRMHPGIVFIAIIGALALAGVLAALIIIPVVGSIIVIGRYVYYKVLDLEPWPDAVKEERLDTAETQPSKVGVQAPGTPIFEPNPEHKAPLLSRRRKKSKSGDDKSK